MARGEPKFVRLPAEKDVAPVGILADVEGGTGWSISGLDVREMPTPEDEEYRYVQSALRNGLLEEASQEEFDHIQRLNSDLAKLHPVALPEGEAPSPWNEPAINRAAKEARKGLMRMRRGEPNPEPADETTEDEPPDYDSMRVEELRARLGAEGLDVNGTKRELVARLEEHDASVS